MIFEWESGSDKIGDLLGPEMGRLVVRRTVFDTLFERFGGIQAEEVEMFQDSRLKPSQRKKRVWLPYVGPELVELKTEATLPLSHLTTLDVAYRCEECGLEIYNMSGIERKESRWDTKQLKLVPYVEPRVPGKGLFVELSKLESASPIFRVERYTQMILCTDEVKRFVEERGYTNVDFLNYGTIIT
ncbi:hypothetical protein LEP1GSC175_2351 [Leptospira santarosai str. HAI821]|uniref:hypothetical protein n=1 Tax=Leptospira santarosai TaxID=28183 RepID=UPI0002BFFFC5|nr:hypothetical protein [Leptospira santarosai]EMO31374.1 hypothetical protein LEP1GSC175_2351 [Leptospira santarosai str. HAI821]